jgi:hypothetical protein
LEEQQSIAKQLKFIQQGTPTLAVMSPCRVGDGILSLTEDQKDQYRQLAHQTAPSVTLFVPASGSGSRMFEFLKEFIHYPNLENAQRAARFYSRLSEFALFRKLPKNIQKNYLDGKLQLEELIDYLLGSEGLNFGNIPKGLIPFHIQEPFILNPFQEQLLQAAQLSVARCRYHFTIQQEFEKDFKVAIDQIAALTSRTYEVTYSVQDPSTDAFVFKTDGQLLKNADGRVVRRPAGHGTLLRNLDLLDSEYILVKNIDNVQHFSQQVTSNITWEVLLGLQMQIRSDLKQFVQCNDFDGFCSWNERFALYDQQWLMQQKDNAWQALLNRPLRVCGMVKNDGQPGGGPFYVSVNGQNAETNLNGAYLVKTNQLVDNHTVVDHLVANCQSNELYKGVLYDKSTAVFNGKVFVRPNAQKINAFQSNGNVLLSDDASVNSKPELEIYADDVKCSHGSTTGQLDENAIFYLRARGISEKSAKELLVSAFISEVLSRIENKEVFNFANTFLNVENYLNT